MMGDRGAPLRAGLRARGAARGLYAGGAVARFLGGVAAIFDRPLFLQPGFDDACRAYLTRPATVFSAGFDDAVRPELLPAEVLASLGHGGKGYSRFVLSDPDKSLLRQAAGPLPDDRRALVTAAFWV